MNILKEALQTFKKEQTQENLQHLAQAVLATKVYAPATWDVEPTENENGQLEFAPNTQIQLLIIEDTQKNCYFPLFTDLEEVQAWKENQRTLLLSFEQWIRFTDMAKEQVKGVIINPMSEQFPILQDLIQNLKQVHQSQVETNELHAGETIHLMEPSQDIENMKAIIQNVCSQNSDIQAVYIKERFETDKKSHWFVLVDSKVEDTQYFEQIGQSLVGQTYNKKLEFMFANNDLATQIIQKTKPIYEKK